MASQPSPADDRTSAYDLIAMTGDIVAAHVSNNSVSPDQIPQLIQSVHKALAGLGKEQQEQARPEPAVSIRSSVKKDHIVCLEDGKKMKMLKRHLMTDHSLTPAEYRARWGLSSDYPMVAPDYAEKRRALAKKIGLGRKPGQKPAAKKAANNKTTAKPRTKKAAKPRKKPGTKNGSNSAGK